MIIKVFELTKINPNLHKFFLLYGENEGLKDEVTKKIEKKFNKNIYRYEEKEILENKENFFNGILTKSLFESEKLIIISRVTDKIRSLIEEIIEKKGFFIGLHTKKITSNDINMITDNLLSINKFI